MDYSTVVQNLLAPGEKCHIVAVAGLVRDWVKTTRVLALVEFKSEFGLFVYTTLKFPTTSKSDLELDQVLPVNSHFKCETEVVDGFLKDIYVKLSSNKVKLLFEMPFVPETTHFTTEICKAMEAFSRQTKPAEFTWLQKYRRVPSPNNPFADDVFDPLNSNITTGFEDDFSQVQLRHPEKLTTNNQDNGAIELDSPDSFKHLPRKSIAMGATPLAARDSVVRLQMTMREEDYINLYTFRIFVGTWNVNGQAPTESLADWLAQDEEPPDMYAVGFQELDLSTEAFFLSESPREDEWFQAVKKALHPKAQYKEVKLIRLVGMMLIVFIQDRHFSCVSNVDAVTVGTGILGKMGNKGGVAIRLDLHSTSICFVNSHLAAHSEECERRNQDFNDICARVAFNQFIPPKAIKNHDQIIWLGDLNYRINTLDAELVKNLLDNKDFALLMENDQLKMQCNLKKVFVGFQEGEITFLPTYKYDPGTNNWDTSDKCRTPAWCDRILWKGSLITQLNYRSHKSLKISDHKPVSSVFESKIKVVDNSKYRRIYEEVMKKLDKLENEFLPQVAVDSTEVTFHNLRFIESQFRYLTIANTGQVPVQFEFIKKLNDTNYCKEWLKIKPYTSFIMPGEKCDIELEVYIDKYTAPKLNSAQDKIYDILVLHLEGGKDIFITISGTYEPSCFGVPLERLVLMEGPIRQVPVEKLIDLEASPVDDVTTTTLKEPLDIPREIWRLVDHLFTNALYQEHLFEQPGLHSEIQLIRECLDTGVPEKIPGSNHSVAETLLIFLEALPEPVIPFNFYNKCLDNATNFIMCKQILTQIPLVHRNVFKYLMSFLRELLSHSDKNKLDNKMLTTLFGSTLIRAPRSSNDPSSRVTSSPVVDRKKATFIYHFFVNDYNG